MKGASPVFVARRGYRLRRVVDTARVLPLIGAFLFMLPVLWSGGGTGRGIIYVFVVWFALIVGAAVLSRLLRAPEIDGELAPDDEAE